ncbi:MAG: NAD-dependent protein deacylase [Clostridiales Family XIII bacterium]|jgi:NAD-dependent deacetylase|nr:NAD-dependent protein deacylase [Clostridiales Family XIII bacterium]
MANFESLKEIIDGSSNIVFFGGAGVSTESGIPDFRSEAGLYKAQQEYGRSPESIISHSSFMADPALFYAYYKGNMIFPDAQPNNAHKALAKLERDGKLSAVVTQNIDGLHDAAGSACVRELHGSVHRNYCLSCGAKFGLGYILDAANCVDSAGKQTSVPYCNLCGGMVRPDVVLYEEALDENVVEDAVNAIAAADTLIVGGTSLVVYPAAGYLGYFHGGTLVLVNKSETGYDSKADLVIREPIAEVFSEFL